MNETIYTFTDARTNLAILINNVIADHTPVIVRSAKKKEVVILSRDDYSSLTETAQLLGNPVMAKRLAEAREEVKAGKTFKVSREDLLKELN